MNISHLMNVTVTHRQPTKVSDGQGGWIETFADAESYAGRLQQPSSGVRTLQDLGKEVGHVSHELIISPVPTAGTFKIGDRVVIDSRTFEIKIPNIQPSIAVYQKLALLELQ
jgi:hypothetical protein